MLVMIAATALFRNRFQDVVKPPPPPVNTYHTSLDLGGNVHIDIKVSLMGFPNSVPDYLKGATCVNLCKGNVHLRHEDCDRKCDEPCNATHVINASASYDEIKPLASDAKDFRDAVQKMGMAVPTVPDFNGIADGVIAPVLKDPKNSVHIKLPHWNSEPCSSSSKYPYSSSWRVNVNWHLFRYDQGPDGQQIRVDGPDGFIPVGDLETYSFDPLQKPSVYVKCRCRILLQDSKTSMIDNRTKTGGEYALGNGVQNCSTESPFGTKDIQKINFSVSCQNLDTAICTAENPCPYPVDVCISPGSLCTSEDPAFQSMMFILPLQLHLPANGQVSTTIEQQHGPWMPDFADQVRAKGRIACVEMHKKEPTSDVRYHIAPSGDLGLARLANIATTEASLGSQD